MFPNDFQAQGFGQQYPFNQNNGYYNNVAKRPCFPNYPGHLQYPYLPMTTQQHSAPVYPQSLGYPPMLEEESRRRKVVQVIPNDYERPIWTFTGLALLALLNSPNNTATTDDIYNFVLSNFPFYIDQNHASWTGAIRHNLTKKKNLFERSSESKRNGKWRIISVEEAKKKILREVEKTKKNPRCGMDNQGLFNVLVSRFQPSQIAPDAPSMSPVPIHSEPAPSPIWVNTLENSPSSIVPSMYPVLMDSSTDPVYTVDFPIMQFNLSNPHICFNGTSIESAPVNDLEDSPTVSVEHLEFEIINEEF